MDNPDLFKNHVSNFSAIYSQQIDVFFPIASTLFEASDSDNIQTMRKVGDFNEPELWAAS